MPFPTRVLLLTGLVLAVLLVANFLVQRTALAYFADLYIRGLTPLFVIAITVFVLARSQRSRPLGIFAVGFLGLVVLVNFYSLEGLTDPIGLSLGYRTNVVVAGAVLVLAGAAFGLTNLATHRRAS